MGSVTIVTDTPNPILLLLWTKQCAAWLQAWQIGGLRPKAVPTHINPQCRDFRQAFKQACAGLPGVTGMWLSLSVLMGYIVRGCTLALVNNP